jgi:hypothetical protein
MGAEYERDSLHDCLYSCDNIPTKGATSGPPGATLGGHTKGIKPRGVTKSSAVGQTVNSVKQSFNLMGNASTAKASNASQENLLRSMNCCSNPAPEPLGFDMGTRYGESKESRVIEVEFEKGILAFTTSIYYASRQSLIEMGVPLTNEKQVSFPEPFAGNKYSVPPKDWKG